MTFRPLSGSPAAGASGLVEQAAEAGWRKRRPASTMFPSKGITPATARSSVLLPEPLAP